MDRILAAQERLQANRALALKAKEAGPPCSTCQFRTLLGMCGNPAYAEPSFDPVKGSYEEAFWTPITAARSADGLCGPEGVLFSPQNVPQLAAGAAWIGAKVIWFGAVGTVLAIFLLT